MVIADAAPCEGDVEDAAHTVDVDAHTDKKELEDDLNSLGLISFVAATTGEASSSSSSSTGGPPPPPPPPPPFDYGNDADNDDDGRRGIKWGPFSISRIVKNKVHIAWGGIAICTETISMVSICSARYGARGQMTCRSAVL